MPITYPVKPYSTSPMYVTQAPAQLPDQIKSSQDIRGIRCDAPYSVLFTGTYDPVGLQFGAATVGLPPIGSYVVGGVPTGANPYCAKTEVYLERESFWNGTTTLPGKLIYVAHFEPISYQRFDLAPASRPMIISGSGLNLQETRRRDFTGKAVINSAGDFHSDCPPSYIPGNEFTFKYNTTSNPATFARAYSNSMNSDALWSGAVPIGQALIGMITYEEVIEKFAGTDYGYWAVTIPMRIRTDTDASSNPITWAFFPWDYGYRYKSSGQLLYYTASNGAVDTSGIAGPVFLDGSGNLLHGTGVPTSSTDPVVYPTSGYQMVNSVAFGSMPPTLPNPFTYTITV